MRKHPVARSLLLLSAAAMFTITACRDAPEPLAPETRDTEAETAEATSADLAPETGSIDSLMSVVVASSRGGPQAQIFSFAAPDFESYDSMKIVLEPSEAGSFPASALVRLDGANVFVPSDFNRNISHLASPIAVAEAGEVEVEIRSGNSAVRVAVYGYLKPGYRRVGRDGGVVRSPDGEAQLEIGQGLAEGSMAIFLPVDEQVVEEGDEPVGSAYSVEVIGPAGGAAPAAAPLGAPTATDAPPFAIARVRLSAIDGTSMDYGALVEAGIVRPIRIPRVIGEGPPSWEFLVGQGFQPAVTQGARRGPCSENGLYGIRPTSQSSGSGTGPVVILLHGWQLGVNDCIDWRREFELDAQFTEMIPALGALAAEEGAELDVYRFTYPTYNPVDFAAAELESDIDAQFAGRDVILVGHSMGGLVARAARDLLGSDEVVDVITLGSPHEGSALADILVARATAAEDLALADCEVIGSLLGQVPGVARWRAECRQDVRTLYARYQSEGLRDLQPNRDGNIVDVLRLSDVTRPIGLLAGDYSDEAVALGTLLSLKFPNLLPLLPILATLVDDSDVVVSITSAHASALEFDEAERTVTDGAFHVGMPDNDDVINYVIERIRARITPPGPLSSIQDDFNDDDFRIGAVDWGEPQCSPGAIQYPGYLRNEGGEVRYTRSGAGGRGGGCAVVAYTEIPVDATTEVAFDARVDYQSLAGSGCCGTEYPISLTVFGSTPDGKVEGLTVGVATSPGVPTVYEEPGLRRQWLPTVNDAIPGQWVRDIQVRLHDYAPDLVVIDSVSILGGGWDVDARLDNVRLPVLDTWEATLLFADDFSGGLSNWVENDLNNLGSARIDREELVIDYNIGCGSTGCHQFQLLLAGVRQPGGDWRMEVDAILEEAYCCYRGGAEGLAGNFSLYVSPQEKESMYIGRTWLKVDGPITTSETVGVGHQVYPWRRLSPRDPFTVPTFSTAEPQRATLEKRGDTYYAYWNGQMIYRSTRAFSEDPRIGLHTYGKIRVDNFKLYRLTKN